MLKRVNGWYGWRPDVPDYRDLRFKLPSHAPVALPPVVDLRFVSGDPNEESLFPPCYDQLDLGSCTANAIAAALEFNMRKQGEKRACTPSRLFIYYNEREAEGTIGEDAGAMIRTGIKSVNQLGAPSEKLWPYKVSKFTRKPAKRAYKQAMARQALRYERLNPVLPELKACLASGFPFVFGFAVYDYFEGKEIEKDGILFLPNDGEDSVGGHAVLCVGYDDRIHRFLIRNSWGSDWGDNGYFTMPYEYLTNRDLSDDFWVVKAVE